ncbi:MAG: hypothetical protein GY774_09470 [Planctomycetes bacterium]|nr:hypothetical protein [Planctomycetota bacterium]
MVISIGGSVVPCLMLILMLVLPFIETDENSQEPNKRQSVTSPSGKYVLNVPIERSEDHGLFGFGEPYRHVIISDPNGNILYRDHRKDFPARFGTYWIWDEKDRAWIFASDEGIFYYECTNGIWTRNEWWQGNKDNAEKGIRPPMSLYPSYYFKQNKKNEIYLMLFLTRPNHLQTSLKVSPIISNQVKLRTFVRQST